MFNFRKINTQDLNLSKIQDNIAEAFKYILSKQIIDSTIITINFTQNLDQQISHGLNRPIKGFLITRANNFGQIIESPSTNNNKNKYIILLSNCDMTADVMFF